MSDFPRKAQFPLLIALATVPLGVMILAPHASALLPRLGWFPALYVLLAWAALLVPGKLRLPLGLLGAAALLGLGVWLLDVRHAFPWVLIPGGYAALLLIGLPGAAWPREREISAGWYVAGVFLHAAAQVMVNVAKRTHSMPAMVAAQPMLIALFILFLALVMLSMNRAGVNGAAMGRQRVPASMRRKNVLLTLGLLAVSLVLAALPGMVAAIECAWGWLTRAVARLVAWFFTLLAPPMSPAGSGASDAGAGLPTLGEAREPSMIWVILERVMMVVALIATIVLAVLLVRFLLRRLVMLIRWLTRRLGRYAALAMEDYVDEITDTREDDDAPEHLLLDRLRGRLNWGDDRRLPPGPRIRRKYLRLRLRHADWHVSQTARETIPADAAEMYERARYSEHKVSEEDARRFEQATRRL